MKQPALLLILSLTAVNPAAGQSGHPAGADIKPDDIDPLMMVSEQQKLLRALPPPPPPARDTELVPGRLIDQAGQVMKFIDLAAEGDAFESTPGCSRDALGRVELLCGARWRKGDAFSDFRARYDRVNRGVKSSLFGKALADHIEIDLDTSPEIKFEFEFD